MENFLSFDLENWYDSEFVSGEYSKDFVLDGLNKVLGLLEKYDVKATFFVTGDVLEKYPKEVKELYKMGHEIASHSYEHKMLSKMDEEDIKSNLIRSKELIKKITGKTPLGFRAPCYSISKDEFWVYDFLEKENFVYSSSLFPINMGLYGGWDFPTDIFFPTSTRKFVEIPIRPFELGKMRIPFSGGVYFRIWPRNILKFYIRKINERGKSVMLYLHPWEFLEDIPKVQVSAVGKITTYWGLKWNESKLDYILRNFKFNSIENILKNKKFN